MSIIILFDIVLVKQIAHFYEVLKYTVQFIVTVMPDRILKQASKASKDKTSCAL